MHLVEVEREQPCLADLLQLLVAHLEIDDRWLGEDCRWSVGEGE